MNQPSASPAPQQKKTTQQRYGTAYCTICGFAVEYCGCARVAAEEHTATDGDESGLRQRIIEVTTKRGSR